MCIPQFRNLIHWGLLILLTSLVCSLEPGKWCLGGGFKNCLFSPLLSGKWFPFCRAYFSDGLVQPPTRIVWIQGCFGIHTYLFPNHQFTVSWCPVKCAKQINDISWAQPIKTPNKNLPLFVPNRQTGGFRNRGRSISEGLEMLGLGLPLNDIPKVIFFCEMNPSSSIYIYIFFFPKKKNTLCVNTHLCVFFGWNYVESGSFSFFLKPNLHPTGHVSPPPGIRV